MELKAIIVIVLLGIATTNGYRLKRDAEAEPDASPEPAAKPYGVYNSRSIYPSQYLNSNRYGSSYNTYTYPENNYIQTQVINPYAETSLINPYAETSLYPTNYVQPAAVAPVVNLLPQDVQYIPLRKFHSDIYNLRPLFDPRPYNVGGYTTAKRPYVVLKDIVGNYKTRPLRRQRNRNSLYV